MAAKPKILVVEDDFHLMEGIRDILELNDYQVMTATNGAVALELLEAQPRPPDLIVSDIMMPRMNGYEFFKAVRANRKWVAIPVIFLTARGERDDIKLGKSMGVEDYVVKPFDADELLIAVSAKLERRKQLDAVWQGEVSHIKHNIMTVINHELRTPLTYVVAYADMAHRDADELNVDDMRAFLRGINTGANRLRRLVENFILLVELETGEAQHTYNWRRVLLNDFSAPLRAIEAKYRDLADERRVKLDVAVEDDLPVVEADPEYLAAALECLVDNAIKFSDKPGGNVQVRAYRDGDTVCLAVTDGGRGIPEHELTEIFKSFYQIDRARYEDQGAGSGLAIAEGIMRLHGGEIAVDSQVGRGSTFTLRLPISAEQPEQDE